MSKNKGTKIRLLCVSIFREITSRYLNFYFHAVLAKCDNNFDFTAIKRVIQKDYKHPNSLFGKLQSSQVNKTVKLQYEIEWLERYKMIKYNLQPIKYVDQCNSIGLKLYHLLHEFQTNEKNIFKCSHGYEDTVSDLVDFYIAQTFLKNCEGNLEMLAHGIYKLLKYDCSRAYRYKIAYFNSQYLNLFRACDPDRTVNDLLNSGNFNESCKAPASAKKIDCAWYEIVCKYPETCLKSMKWLVDWIC